MGLDIVELMMRVEEEFDIEIPDADAQGIETVGALSTYVALRVGWERREAIWLGLRDLIAEEFAIPPEQILPESHFVYDLGLD